MILVWASRWSGALGGWHRAGAGAAAFLVHAAAAGGRAGPAALVASLGPNSGLPGLWELAGRPGPRTLSPLQALLLTPALIVLPGFIGLALLTIALLRMHADMHRLLPP